MIYRWYDIPYGYDICVADDIRSAYGGVATPQIQIMGFRPYSNPWHNHTFILPLVRSNPQLGGTFMKKYFRILTGCILFAFLISLVSMFPVSAAETSATCTAPAGKTISVMSFNVLNNNNKDSSGNFKYDPPATREKAIATMIKAYKPDIIGVQEAGQGGDSGTLNWCSALNTDLKGTYAYRSLKDDTGLALDVYRGLIIFYNKSRFTLVSSGGQGYSDPANNKRAFQWVKLKDKNTNTEFYVFNTHWQYEGSQTLAQNTTVRAKHMKELAAKVKSLAGSTHFIVTGDFNSSYTQKDGSLCDGENIAKFVATNSAWADGTMTAPNKYTIDGSGNKVTLASTDSSLQTGVDHIIYPTTYYEATQLRKIKCRTFSPMLSDHDAYIVDFTYKMPGLTASSAEGELDAFYSNDAYYVDNFAKRTTDLAVTVKPTNGTIYSDEACTTSAGTALTIKTGETQTYRPNNTLYLKWGGMVQTLYLRTCNANTMANSVFVDKAFVNKAAGSTSLYCDKWYCRKVTVGVNGFATIQDAVNAAGDGYQVLVAPGTYTEEVSYSGKSLKFYGQNRTNLKALVIKDGQLTVNSANRTYETYLSGSITYDVGNQVSSSIMVNGFHFTNYTATGQVRITGGDATKTVDMRICNNLFNCYTNGAASNGSAVHGISAIQKTGSIEDNYFHLTKVPTYTDSSGATKNYTNRGITLRNLKDITIIANYFDGYTGSNMRPFWLSSEVSSGSTTPGYGNVAILGNRFENCYPGALNINNIRSTSNANVLIGGNSYGGEVMNVTFTDTANQTAQNLPTDKSKITFKVQTADYSSLKITDGPSCTKFSYYVTFRNEDGMYIYGNSAVSGTTATYNGVTPTKASNGSNHYTFAGWVTEKNGTTALNLSTIKATTNAYASFTTTAHTMAVRSEKAATCTEPGYTGDRYCTVCSHVISTGTEIAPTGHTEAVEPGIPATCTTEGLTEGIHCGICNAVISTPEIIPATGHSYTYTKADGQAHIIGCENCDLSDTVSHTYENGTCICGEAEIKEPIVDTSISIGHTLNLASDISINFAVRTTLLTDYVNHCLVVDIPVYEGNEQTGIRTVTIEPVLNGNYYYYTLTGLTAVNMGDVVSAQLHMEKDGQEYLSKVDTYSVSQYAYSQLNKAGVADKLKALCADLLRYGKEAQIYKSYRLDSLVDAAMTEENKAYLSDAEAVVFGNTNKTLTDLANPQINWAGKSLILDSKVCLKFIFSASNYEGAVNELTLRVSYTDTYGAEKTLTLADPELYNEKLGYYAFTLDSLLAAELRSVVSVQVYAGDSPVSATLQYSPDTYGNNKTGQLLTLCKALIAYSDTAKAYFS